jgi:hypothetical protein
MIVHSQIFVDGPWVDPSGREAIQVVYPATEGVIASVPWGAPQDVDPAARAVRAAHAFGPWSCTLGAERADLVERIARILERRSDEITRTIVSEVGHPVTMAVTDQTATRTADLDFTAEAVNEIDVEEHVGPTVVTRTAAWVVRAITPWTAPMKMVCMKARAAMAAGCTVVLEGTDVAPMSSSIFAGAVAEVGAPARQVSQRRHPGRGPSRSRGRGYRRSLPQRRAGGRRPVPGAGAAGPVGRGRGDRRGEGTHLLELREVELPDPGPFEVMVEQYTVSVCRSQLDRIFDPRRISTLLTGHESLGRVVAAGSEVTHVGPGDEVFTTCLPRSPRYCRAPDIAPLTLTDGVVETSDNSYMYSPHTAVDEQYDKGAGRERPSPRVGDRLRAHARRRCGDEQRRQGRSRSFGRGLGRRWCGVVRHRRGHSRAERIVAVDVSPNRPALAENFGASDVVDVCTGDSGEVIRQLAPHDDGTHGVDFSS